MARVKRGVTAHKRHKRLLHAAEGRRGTRSRLIKPAREAQPARDGVRVRRAASSASARCAPCGSPASTPPLALNGLTYSRLIIGLKAAGVALDRKILADICVRDAATFARIAEVAKTA